MGRKWKLGSGLRNDNTFGGMKTDCVLSKIIGTSRFAAIFQIIEKQYFEKLATQKSRDMTLLHLSNLLTSIFYD